MGANLPTHLGRGLSTVQREEACDWWRQMSPACRHTLRRDAGRRPVRVVARFVEPGDGHETADEPNDFYEYLVNHEIYLDDGPPLRICSSHPEARTLIARGLLPASFACPRSDAACPMRALLDRADGRDVRLCKESPHG
jgi:hypothetical protein